MQKNFKENHLKSYASKSINSKGRIYKEKENSIRSPYQRDRDRIIHSSSFRRLKHKTQVFVNSEGDHYRTTLDGLIKHNGPVRNIGLFDKILKKNLFSNKIIFNTFPSLEAQVASIADDIAYNNHDLEDGLRAGLFTIKKFNSISFISKLINRHVKNIKNFKREIIISQIVRELINMMVICIITKKLLLTLI